MSDGEEDNPLADIELVEIYAAGSQVGADRIVMILQDDGIEALGREITMSEMPSTANQRYIVTVPGADQQKASAVIQQAIDDEILPPDGTFLNPN